MAPDPIALARDLIRCPSVTPADAGALDRVQSVLEGLGFTCHRLPFQEPGTERVDNLYARLGDKGPNFCFAGHTDVVPAGDAAAWTVDPFGGEIIDGRLYGRGAADMKGGVAAFIAAVGSFLERNGPPAGSISLLITGDEEGPAVNGTRKVLDWMAAAGERIDACLVGEPTNPRALGDMIKVGRRGSLTATLTALGAQGHTAYPHLADNPLPRLAEALHLLASSPLDMGTPHFQPSTLALTSIDVGNPASNVIPARGTARFNIRFNDLHTPESLEAHIRDVLEEVGGAWELALQTSGVAFLTPPGALSDIVAAAVEAHTGRTPELSTSGGTSDARFIKDHCPVVEFGLVGASMHKVDENVAVADLLELTAIYRTVLERWFAGAEPRT
ncbi:succinyl-diaminopimelate desuccinylase [Rhodospirillum centenum]|uniref:Succinyl-diaminopimelate desuccinylase n=1 Tax=Rhodospirillum centenum (strain ATCC 51521 / SW) TaxID=414684 RepID=DAPE_RHOCS|nr:succinyl-diaminopimelate desuccinylase [Rhodospirillum centenum]B6IPH8.1 RecName: Full=Succinyl-diaminopimelate desuccinylase; Short=SDAP desuccinylase; AltName: Full=N-succinyl-LL-2,6-diaminoheptanedioate amidohydrolase [Rhodospirillum centenum SW]ACI99680.1 succinyl-diaminopimelate desuccinylase [Rhodospirillum centenum SW]